ncbi:rhomboid family intramembrane serine protease [Rhizobium sp. AG855]|uniref:rhomboid family intramembrane serine protease n=1 Tax=Rhizobium sp. AG855 TaxID=2183898 RepID=UPI000E71BAE8|nr:rhomboid family intramembrane serine protease [Rhizobium sp. AG855]RKE84848.1 membrane associated rhomboid family serine protease [Rhizobium sp. AG855]
MSDDPAASDETRHDSDAPPHGEARISPKPVNPPIFNLPTGVLVSLALVCGIYALQALVFSADINDWITFEFAFMPLRYVYPLGEQSFAWLWSPVTYSLLHGSFEHLAFNSLWLAAFGTPVCRRIGERRFLVFWIATAVAAAALHAAVNWGEPSVMVGASGVISALMGAACRFAFGGRLRLAAAGREPPLLTIPAALSDRTVQIFILVWFLGNVAVAVGLPLMGTDSAAIAWDAHIGGFLMGFFGFRLFDRKHI